MEIFVLDNEIARLDTACLLTHDSERLVNLVTLCWHLRQRDTGRALALADEADALLSLLPAANTELRILSARLLLVRAEAKFLFLERDSAYATAQLAVQAFSALGDSVGCSDAHRLLALIADERGNFSGRDAALEIARQLALSAGTPLRAEMAEIGIAYFSICRTPRTERDWHDRINAMVEHGRPAVIAWAAAIQGTCAILTSNFGRAISCGILAYDSAVRTGQIRFAIKAAIKIGFAFSKLNEHQAALEWMQRGLDLARPTGWPECVGLCLSHTVSALRQVGRAEAAQKLVDEALGTSVPSSDSYSYSRILQHHGQLAFERGDFRTALTTFTRLEQRADRLSQPHFQIESRRWQAYALSSLERSMEAHAIALTALTLAQMQGDRRREVAALQLLAEIHARHPMPASNDMYPPSAPLFFLTKALALASNIDGFSIPPELLDALAREYATVGDFAQAYKTLLQSIATRDESLHMAAEAHSLAHEAICQAKRIMQMETHFRQQKATTHARGDDKNDTHDAKQLLLRKPPGQKENPDRLIHYLASANHRLRQPIHAMNLYLGAMALQELPPKARPLLDNVRQCAQALGESFLSLLDLSRLQTNGVQPHYEPFPIMRLLSRIKCEYAGPAQAKGLDFYMVPCNAWVESDQQLVEQILRNLAANALHFTHCGKILIGCRRKNDVLRVAIYDTGVGMTPDLQHFVLEEFPPVGSDEGGIHGLGLGLTIVKQLGHLLSVPITLKSEKGKGSMFAIDLPLLKRDSSNIDAASGNAATSDIPPKKLVVVVDSDCGILDTMRTLLEKWHCSVVTASSGKEVLAKLGASVRSPDALICDFHLLPNETGLDVIRALRFEFNQEIPALLVTGEAVAEQAQNMIPHGIPLMQKPVQADTLRQVLALLLSLQNDHAL